MVCVKLLISNSANIYHTIPRRGQQLSVVKVAKKHGHASVARYIEGCIGESAVEEGRWRRGGGGGGGGGRGRWRRWRRWRRGGGGKLGVVLYMVPIQCFPLFPSSASSLPLSARRALQMTWSVSRPRVRTSKPVSTSAEHTSHAHSHSRAFEMLCVMIYPCMPSTFLYFTRMSPHMHLIVY